MFQLHHRPCAGEAGTALVAFCRCGTLLHGYANPLKGSILQNLSISTSDCFYWIPARSMRQGDGTVAVRVSGKEPLSYAAQLPTPIGPIRARRWRSAIFSASVNRLTR